MRTKQEGVALEYGTITPPKGSDAFLTHPEPRNRPLTATIYS
jgi:hypothetical protein